MVEYNNVAPAPDVDQNWTPQDAGAGKPLANVPNIAPLPKPTAASVNPRPSSFMGLSDLMAMRGPIDWLVKGWMERDCTGVLWGPSGACKSFLAISLATHISAGKPWQGFKVKRGAVFYILGEGKNGFANRVDAAIRAHGLDADDMDFYTSHMTCDLTDPDSAESIADEIARMSKACGQTPAFVVIDTLARNFGAGDENSTVDMNRFVHNVDETIRNRLKTTVLVVHHSGHVSGRERGSSSLRSAVAFSYGVERDGDDPSAPVIVKNMKMKEAPTRKAERFMVNPIVLSEGRDADGDAYQTTSLTLHRDVEWIASSNTLARQEAACAKRDQRSEKLQAAIGKTLVKHENGLSQADLARSLEGSEFGKNRTVIRNIKKLFERGPVEHGAQVLICKEEARAGGQNSVIYELRPKSAPQCQ